MKHENEKGNKNIFMGVFFIVAALVFLFSQEQDNLPPPGPQSVKTQGQINQHLQDTQRGILIQEQRAAIEAQKVLNELRESKPQKPYKFDGQNLEISEYNEHHDFNERVGRGHKGFGLPSDPNSLIQTELFKDDQELYATEEFKKEYARQFVENARQQGWAIKLDSQYKVISVRPLNRQPAYQIFNSDSGGQN